MITLRRYSVAIRQDRRMVVYHGAKTPRRTAVARDPKLQGQLEILARDWIALAVAEFRAVRLERQNPPADPNGPPPA
jgi:hypothetical protein